MRPLARSLSGTARIHQRYLQWLISGLAVTDMPAYCFSSELIEAYPEVILTLRDIDDWHE
jgi:hypothetical protein